MGYPIIAIMVYWYCVRHVEREQPIMILPQVHLRKPCYDFYFLQAIEFERLLGQRCRRLHARPKPIRGPH
ncbi:hypothetical protein RRG08_046802 [Elysia crispata]|uniref:Uncharacterized protein n=1 Tax=Elysia crispata TaxID=231223 RepID=A0AAE1DAH4_9GAST|nr:hypothetical protein RRG08_046802 [Elysia crispata]